MLLYVNAESERKDIIRSYRRLLRKAKPILKDGDMFLIKRAFSISLEAHKNMRRKSGEPYIFHPLAVAEICVSEIGLGVSSIIASLLHDVVEDSNIELTYLEKIFGAKIAKIISGLTKIKGIFGSNTSEQAENFRRMLITLSEDVRVILIKLADRLHNMRTLESMPRHKQLRISSETIYLYAPLAHRLGLNSIKTELEDLYLRFTDPNIYHQISRKIDASRASRNRFIKRFLLPIRNELKNLGIPFEIRGRPKSVYSIYNKMQNQNIPFEEVYDLFAIRVIIETTSDQEKSYCWQVYSIVTDFYTPNPRRLRDWINTPKANGYESLHTTVMASNGQWVEVQIRTRRMDEIAEKGYAAHWKYKDESSSESNIEKWLVRVGEILKQQDITALEFVDVFKDNLYSKEIFVFTPRGELRTLPQGASALDFAFDIHTDVGFSCIGAKINHKLVPINQKLNNGDQVEILTSTKQKPNEGWLQYVVTSKAKSRIRDIIKEKRKLVIEEGQKKLDKKLKQLNIEDIPGLLDKLCSFFKVKSHADLYFKIGNDTTSLSSLKQFKNYEPTKTVTHKTRSASKKIKSSKNELLKEDTLLIGDDMNVIDYKLAKCCAPISGDDVFGYVTIHEGIKIHRTTCHNAPELLSNHGDRIIKARWDSVHKLSFLTGLKVTGMDRLGLVNDISTMISQELNVNMKSLIFNTNHGIFSGQITLYVNDKRHIDVLISQLKKINNIVHVQRFNPSISENH